jgi:hypothetical protein
VRSRHALVTIGVLACLVVVVSLAGSLVVSTLRARREANVQHQLRQTDYLLDAGIQRAMAQLQNSTDYSGETWVPGEVPHFYRAKVVIVAVSKKEEDLSTIEVVASLANRPADADRSSAFVTQRSHRWTVSRTEISRSQ